MKNTELVKKLRKNVDKLCKDLIKNPKEIKSILKMWKQSFYPYSFYNTCLIMSQGGTQVASYKRWQKHNRQVKKGSKALRVLAPVTYKKENEKGEEEKKLFFKAVPVFDISQTEGEPLKFHKNNGLTATDLKFEDMKNKIKYPVSLEIISPRGYTDGHKIVINSELEDSDKICTLIHEMAHIKRKHIENNEDKKTEELEAETIAFIVTTALGIKNEISKAYIKNWWSENPEKEIQDKATDLIKDAYNIYNQVKNC